MFWNFSATNVDVVADGLNFFQAGLQHVDLARHFTLTLTPQHQKSRMQILKNKMTISLFKSKLFSIDLSMKRIISNITLCPGVDLRKKYGPILVLQTSKSNLKFHEDILVFQTSKLVLKISILVS